MHPAPTNSRRGVALIVVLGFLAILVLLGVSFAVLMRTERLAARNYADAARAKHLVYAGLTRAIGDIDSDIRSQNLIAPNWVALESFLSSGNTNVCRTLLQGEATNYIPWTTYQAVTTTAAQAQWSNVYDNLNPSRLLGRYAWVAVECGGFLDASVVGGKARTNGSVAAEIDASQPGDMVNWNNFLSTRLTNNVRYENLFELRELVRDSGAIRFRFITNFFHYSRARVSGRWTNELGGIKVHLPLDINTVSDGNLQAILNDCNVPNPADVVKNFRDYLDTDFIPAEVDNFMTEPVPMINEIVLSNRMEIISDSPGLGDKTWIHHAYIVVETWYPFPIMPNLPDFQVAFAPAPPTMRTIPIGEGWEPTTLVTPGPIRVERVPGSGATPAFGPYEFQRMEFHFQSGPLVNPGSLDVLTLRAEIQGIEIQLEDGTPVDRVPNLTPNKLQISPDATLDWQDFIGVSCIDPRINWRDSDWPVASITLTDPNNPKMGTNVYANVNAVGALQGEGVSPMYVRNGPLHSAAELGFLSVGNPWQTIALYDTAVSKLNPVLDYFYADPSITTHPMVTNALSGRVNLNSTNREVLAAGYYGAPAQRYPAEGQNSTGIAGVARMSWAGSLRMANDIRQKFGVNQRYNSSDLGVATSGFENAWSDAEKESVIANTYKLLNPRGNLFTLVVEAQALSPISSNVVGVSKGVAVVWRDPYPTSQTDFVVGGGATDQPFDFEYPFVRFFKWLTD